MRRPPPGVGEGRVEHPILVWERTSGRPVEFPVAVGQPISIGRDATSTIVLQSTFVSRAHARFLYQDGKYVIEDLGSANGTKINGAPVSVSMVVPGDTIEIGEERLVFRDGAAARAAPAGGSRKGLRLALVAVFTAAAMGGVMMVLLPPEPPPLSGSPGPAPGAEGPPAGTPLPGGTPVAAGTPAPAGATAARPDSHVVKQVTAEAQAAGVSTVDALYDRGVLQYRTGRFRDAADLFAAVLARDRNHEGARRMLPDTQGQLERGVAERLARADSFLAQLRFEEAMLQWDEVLQMVDAADPRAAAARAGIERARRAKAQR